jgi:hypothetical protein
MPPPAHRDSRDSVPTCSPMRTVLTVAAIGHPALSAESCHRYTPARWPNADAETDQWGYASCGIGPTLRAATAQLAWLRTGRARWGLCVGGANCHADRIGCASHRTPAADVAPRGRAFQTETGRLCAGTRRIIVPTMHHSASDSSIPYRSCGYSRVLR